MLVGSNLLIGAMVNYIFVQGIFRWDLVEVSSISCESY